MKRKTVLVVLAAAGVLVSGSHRADALVNFTTGAQYDSFTSDVSREKGNQFFTPVTLVAGSENGISGGLATGYVVSTYRPVEEGADDVTVSTFIDTKASLFYSTPVLGGCLRLGSTFNLPTGMNSLDAEERRAEMDNRYGELVEVTNFGEGTNANPGFAFALPLGRLIVGFGLSHHVKGSYDPTSDIENDEVDPGDETLTKVNVAWDGETFQALLGVKYLALWPDKIEGEEVFKEGDMVSVNAKMDYSPGPWHIVLEGAYNTWFKGKRFVGDQLLAVEELERFGDDIVIRAVVEYQVWPTLTVLALGRGHWVKANDYPRDFFLYDGDRSALEGTLGFRYSLFPGFSLNGTVAYQQVKEDADSQIPEDTTYEGFKTALNIETWF